MQRNYTITIDGDGAITIPDEVCQRQGIEPGSEIVLVEADDRIVLITSERLAEIARGEPTGMTFVEQLAADQRWSRHDRPLVDILDKEALWAILDDDMG